MSPEPKDRRSAESRHDTRPLAAVPVSAPWPRKGRRRPAKPFVKNPNSTALPERNDFNALWGA